MDWQPVDTIPTDRVVTVKTVSGIVCLAKTNGSSGWIRPADQWGPRRIGCFRKDRPTAGDVMAVAWKD